MARLTGQGAARPTSPTSSTGTGTGTSRPAASVAAAWRRRAHRERGLEVAAHPARQGRRRAGRPLAGSCGHVGVEGGVAEPVVEGKGEAHHGEGGERPK